MSKVLYARRSLSLSAVPADRHLSDQNPFCDDKFGLIMKRCRQYRALLKPQFLSLGTVLFLLAFFPSFPASILNHWRHPIVTSSWTLPIENICLHAHGCAQGGLSVLSQDRSRCIRRSSPSDPGIPFSPAPTQLASAYTAYTNLRSVPIHQHSLTDNIHTTALKP